MSSDFKAIFWWVLLVAFFAGGGFWFWSNKDRLLSQLNLGKTAVKKEEEALVKHDSGPIAPGCLTLPENMDLFLGNKGYSLLGSKDSLDTFKYMGIITSFEDEIFKRGENECKFYAIGLKDGERVIKVILPWNLKSIPSQSNKEIGDTDGQVLQQFKGQKVKLTIQYQKEGDKRKFFSWKVEVM